MIIFFYKAVHKDRILNFIPFGSIVLNRTSLPVRTHCDAAQVDGFRDGILPFSSEYTDLQYSC